MDFSKLTQNEKLAVYGAVATVVGGAVGGTLSGLGWLALLAAIGVLVVVFIPQFSPQTKLPGSEGSLVLVLGGIAAVIMVLALLTIIGFLGVYFASLPINALLFLIAVIGAAVMAWAGWQMFQAEGGKFQLGTASSDRGAPPPPAATPPPTERAETTQTRADAAPAAAPPPPPPAAAPPPAAPPAEEPRADEPRADEPMGGDEERRDQV